MLPPHTIAIRQLSQEEGISEATLHKWRAEARGKGQPGGRCANGFEDIDRTIAILNSGGVDQDEHHKNRRCRC